jgi:hypothetical protein
MAVTLGSDAAEMHCLASGRAGFAIVGDLVGALARHDAVRHSPDLVAQTVAEL